MENEDDIIVKAFLLVKEGVQSQEWKLIVDAYELITGEKLEIPQKAKSRLEAIREKMGQSKNSDLSNKELTDKLKYKGFTDKELKNKKKADLLSLLEDSFKSEGPNDDEEDEDEDDEEIRVEKQQGGSRFATNGFEVISTPPNEREASKNKRKAKKKFKSPRRENITDLAKKFDPNNDKRDIGYHDEVKRPPEGR